MPKIAVLDTATANQIAAGEVVERPSSVVKELMENSIDAGARRITVEVEGGGRELVRVVDDGCGMDPADAALALQRHATSKLRSADDLLAIQSFGFRGEALPAIASVSRLTLSTRLHADQAGTRVVAEGSEIQSLADCGCPPGTVVEVRDLFFNTPARLRHLKTAATELGRCGDVAARLALAHPEVAVRFRSGRQEVFATSGRGNLLDTAATVLGAGVARELVPVQFSGRAASLVGFAGRPAAGRSSRAHQYLMVNGRPVQALALRYALEEAYHNLIPQGRYPVAILAMALPPQELDVNVHPQKLEVRFVREREIRSDVYRAVHSALAAALVVPGAEEVAATAAARFGLSVGEAPVPPGLALPWPGAGGGSTGPERAREGMAPWQGTWRLEGTGPALPAAGAATGPLTASLGTGLGITPSEVIAGLRPLGQVERSYLACDGPGGLYLVDQHAAHERVYFERFLRTAESGPLPVQALLFPATLELSAAQLGFWQESAELFRECGIHGEPFGGRTLLINAVPAGVSERWAGTLVQDFLDRLLSDGGTGAGPLDRRRRALAALAACKAAVKARDPLTEAEVQGLLRDLASCEFPGQCPHGRPTVILIGLPELERRFGRK